MHTVEKFIGNGKQTTKLPEYTMKANKNYAVQSTQNLEWLLYDKYVRRQFTICRQIIAQTLKENDCRSEYCYYIQGLILREENKLQESLISFQKCSKLNSKNVENIKQVARTLFLLGRYHLSLETYKEAETLIARPDWEIYHYIAECMLRGAVGSRHEALHYLRRAAQNGRQIQSYSLLAEQLKRENDYAAATSVYESALEVTPDGAWLHAELGLLLLEQGETQAAFERLGTAVALRPDCERALLAVASVMQSHGDYDAALAKYKVAAQNCIDSPELWNNIGLCFYYKGKIVTALSCLSRAARYSPLSAPILYSLGMVLLSAQQPASAFVYLSAAANLRPTHALSYMLLAVALQRLGDDHNAGLAFERAYELFKTSEKRKDENDLLVLVNRALYLTLQNNIDAARVHLQEFQKLSTNIEVSEKVENITASLAIVLNVKSKENIDSQLNDFVEESNTNNNMNANIENEESCSYIWGR
ncbi:Bardet-Biedl syndrome 4 protein homolog [Ctenocephalides felis]|uniref:Bardet-Biedl syndrome 4 protein homolog n=1 Tax=Ctenocephalides felis TaxID=7515 RepID=UPI000E6E4802|nr:Bardet-Biedl syndrome 4 protein homolog [Ctenocephalides felis]